MVFTISRGRCVYIGNLNHGAWLTKLRFPLLAGESSSRVSSRGIADKWRRASSSREVRKWGFQVSSEAFRRYDGTTIEWRNRRWEREGFERRNYTGCVVGFAAHTLKKNRAYVHVYTYLVIHVETRGETINRVCKRFFNLEFHSWLAILMVLIHVSEFQRGERERERERKKRWIICKSFSPVSNIE